MASGRIPPPLLKEFVSGFVTNEGRLGRVRELEVMVLDEFVDGKTRT